MGSVGPEIHNVQGNSSASKYTYGTHVLREPRRIRVIMIGAGLSGIGCYKMFKERFAGKPTELIIYEKNADVGGTWLENRYPG